MRSIRISILLLMASCLSAKAIAQNQKEPVPQYNNAVYLELGGPALLYSVGYERTWYQTPGFAAMSSAGVMYFPFMAQHDIELVYIESGMLFRRRNVALELGAAISYYSEIAAGSSPEKDFFLVPRIGVRFYSKNQRWHYKMGFTPLVFINVSPNDRRTERWFNLFTLGYRF